MGQAKWEDVDPRLVKSLLRNVVYGPQGSGTDALLVRLEHSRKAFQCARRDCEDYLRTSLIAQTVGKGLAIEVGPGAQVEFQVSAEGLVQVQINPPEAGGGFTPKVVVPEPEPEIEEPPFEGVEEPPFEGVEEPPFEGAEEPEPEVVEPEVEEPEVPDEAPAPEAKSKRNRTVPLMAELRERAEALGVDISSFGRQRKAIFKHLEECGASASEPAQLDLVTDAPESPDEDIVVIGEDPPVEVIEEGDGPDVDVIVLDTPVTPAPALTDEVPTQTQSAVVDILEIEEILVEEGDNPPKATSLLDKVLEASAGVDLDEACPLGEAFEDDGEEDEGDVVDHEPASTFDDDDESDDEEADVIHHESTSAYEPVDLDDILDEDEDE